jgi:hypothetical protein
VPAVFRALETALNLEFKAVPTPVTAVTIAMPKRAAIKPYSIAVAPLSSETNEVRNVFIGS